MTRSVTERPLWKRLLGMALLLGAVFAGARLLGLDKQSANVSVVYHVPAGARSLEITYVADEGRPVATFSTELFEKGTATHRPKLEAGTYGIDIRLGYGAGREDEVSHRSVVLVDDAVVTVDLRPTR